MKPLLSTASPELKQALNQRANTRTFQKDEELFATGERADYLPIIVKGRAKMMQYPGAGKEVIIGIFGDGEMFAVPPVIDGNAYPASAYAMTTSQILLLHRTEFFRLIRESFEFNLTVLRWLSDMLRQKTRLIRTLAGGSAEQRIAGVLVRLFERDGDVRPVKVSLRREDIARMAGLTTETTIRIVRRLADLGVVRIDRGKILIDDDTGLRALTDA